MNNLPKKVSKGAMTLAMTCGFALPASACGPSFGPVGTAILLGVVALAAAVPVAVTVAGLVSGFRARRDGLSLGKGLVGASALLCELGVARVAGPGSLVGALAVGAGALQLALFVMAAVHGPDMGPLPGRITVLSKQVLGF
jgi:hypothetical protein